MPGKSNFQHIKTTVIGFLLWILGGVYFALPYFNTDHDLWEVNNAWVIALFVGGFLFMAAPDRMLDLLFGWLKKKAGTDKK